MKRAIKGILIASGVFGAVGVSLILAGILMGASWSQVGHAIISGNYWLGNNIFHNSSSYNSADFNDMETADSQTFQADKINNINIEVGAGELTVENGDSEKIQLQNDSSRGKLGVRIDGDTMHIILRGKNNGNGGKASITIPRDQEFNNVQLDVAAGIVGMDSLKTKQLDVNVGAGTFKGTGKIEADIALWNVDAGSIKAANVKSRQSNLDCSVGQIAITLEGKQDDFGFEGSCSIGEIVFGDTKYHSDVELYKNDQHAEQFVIAKCDAGKVEINFTK